MKLKKIAALIMVIVLTATSVGCADKAVGALLGYIVTFDPNGGELVSGELKQAVKPGQSAEPPVLSREGYEFAGYDGDFENIQAGITLKAKWLKIYTVTFDAGDGEIEGEATQAVAEGKSPAVPDVIRDGWIFDGWDREIAPVSGDAVYTALWSRKVFSAMEVSERIAPAVIEITTRDIYGRDLALGSGFFIDDKGTAVTNYHVMEGAYSAKAATSEGREHVVLGVVSYDKELDLAIIKVNLTNSPCLVISKDGVATGQTVYAIGSSLGLTGTFSNGIVSTASRDVEGIDCIQVTAPISQGNSGGPLVNEYCEVVGVNSMTASGGQNLNFAINIKELDKLPEDAYVSIAEFGALSSRAQSFYEIYSEHEKEPNDEDSRANSLVIGAEPIAGEIGSENDMDYYKFSSSVTRRVSICVALGSEYDMISYDFGYYSGSEFESIELAFRYDEANRLFYAEYVLNAGVTYYFAVCAPVLFASYFDYPMYYALRVE